MPCIMDIRVIPLDKHETISHTIARTIDIIKKSGLQYSLNQTSACVEGDWDRLLELATRCHKENTCDSGHILVDLRIIWRKGRKDHFQGVGGR